MTEPQITEILESARAAYVIINGMLDYINSKVEIKQRLIAIYGKERVQTSSRGSFSPAQDALEEYISRSEEQAFEINELLERINYAKKYTSMVTNRRHRIIMESRFLENWTFKKINYTFKLKDKSANHIIRRCISEIAAKTQK